METPAATSVNDRIVQYQAELELFHQTWVESSVDEQQEMAMEEIRSCAFNERMRRAKYKEHSQQIDESVGMHMEDTWMMSYWFAVSFDDRNPRPAAAPPSSLRLLEAVTTLNRVAMRMAGLERMRPTSVIFDAPVFVRVYPTLTASETVHSGEADSAVPGSNIADDETVPFTDDVDELETLVLSPDVHQHSSIISTPASMPTPRRALFSDTEGDIFLPPGKLQRVGEACVVPVPVAELRAMSDTQRAALMTELRHREPDYIGPAPYGSEEECGYATAEEAMLDESSDERED
jgi:hypothetical protein